MEVSGRSSRRPLVTPGKEGPLPIAQETRWVLEPVWAFGGRQNLLPKRGMEPRFLGQTTFKVLGLDRRWQQYRQDFIS
jgi:hypothetical protein